MKVKAMLCVSILAAIAGCGDDDGGAAAGDGAQAEEPVRVAVILAALDNAFYVAEKEGIEEEAENHPDADVTITAGRERTASDEVIGLIEDAIAKDVDAIAVDGSDNTPLIPALKRVIEADIPLVLFDAPAEQLEGQYETFIGTDNEAGGKAAGEWLKQTLPDGGKVGLLLCVDGHPVTVARVKGFEAGLGGKPFEIVSQLEAGCDREKGRKAMEDMITAHPDLDALFSTSDGQSLGAIEALKAAEMDPAFVSFDAQPEAVEAIKAGNVLDASSGWSARTLGAEAIKAAIAAAKGEPVPPSEVIPVTVVDEANAASWKG
ncbi:MAG TPA: sugar ABC transporter substrate-binding protein [Solirubrobacteraceae bacterium]|nr:sugar ABC transporter substrate-binding protein [Solirubrobacteraceae bacterium]